jgi:hypothetical protein
MIFSFTNLIPMFLRITTLLMLVCFTVQLQAQTPCLPNDTVTTVIFPAPEVNGVGGIQQVACVGKPFNFTWTFNIPSQISISGLTAQLDSAVAATTGAVKNLPAGLSYSCNPPNCTFKANAKGCIGVTGSIPANATAPADIELLIGVKIFAKAFGGIPISQDFNLPDAAVTGSGKYILRVRPANDAACTVGA